LVVVVLQAHHLYRMALILFFQPLHQRAAALALEARLLMSMAQMVVVVVVVLTLGLLDWAIHHRHLRHKVIMADKIQTQEAEDLLVAVVQALPVETLQHLRKMALMAVLVQHLPSQDHQ
jgi:hypothetical protein